MSDLLSSIHPFIHLHAYDQRQHVIGNILYGAVKSPFGLAFIASSECGICHISLGVSENPDDLVATLAKDWPSVKLVENKSVISALAEKIFDAKSTASLDLLVKGSEFQLRVWKALLTIPQGKFCSYADIAALIGQPKAYRAVGSAIGKNPVAYLIPCHRVLPKNGGLGGYRWGETIKSKILLLESNKALMLN